MKIAFRKYHVELDDELNLTYEALYNVLRELASNEVCSLPEGKLREILLKHKVIEEVEHKQVKKGKMFEIISGLMRFKE